MRDVSSSPPNPRVSASRPCGDASLPRPASGPQTRGKIRVSALRSSSAKRVKSVEGAPSYILTFTLSHFLTAPRSCSFIHPSILTNPILFPNRKLNIQHSKSSIDLDWFLFLIQNQESKIKNLLISASSHLQTPPRFAPFVKSFSYLRFFSCSY
jgi:hypothetical protein